MKSVKWEIRFYSFPPNSVLQCIVYIMLGRDAQSKGQESNIFTGSDC
jgi:hypothetical protein